MCFTELQLVLFLDGSYTWHQKMCQMSVYAYSLLTLKIPLFTPAYTIKKVLMVS